ncbi:ADP-ribosylation factor-like protein 2-binding protein [Cololabis saira]|uniref:ADP-ribosylation factor-like protein 2-binding protein n=1 Tax=Cololabis saira TaxID=129043 RepID=UPI002AD574E6|nr:ADP-ribosylation factor-like protein 2-binding protein [Cololabis saira]
MVDEDEEVLAASRSSAADMAFDDAIDCIANIILDPEFEQFHTGFMDKHYMEFDDSEENKLSYTQIFNEYVDLVEKHLEQLLMERIPGFNMNTFFELFVQHKEEVPGDIFDMLLTFTDFLAFKAMFLEYRAEKEGRNLDLSQGLVVTSLTPASLKHTGSSE